MSAYEELESRFKRLSHFEHALTILHWDQEVMMPPKGAETRGQAIAELSAFHHQEMTSSDMAGLIEQAKRQIGLNDWQSANLREIERVWQDANLLPEELVREQSIAQQRCQHAWRTQRKENDWAGFKENFKAVVELSRQQANIRQKALGTATAYDALLSLYSTGDSSELIAEVFTKLKSELPAMIQAVTARQGDSARPSFTGPFDVASQRTLSHHVMDFLGFDFDAGRLDESTHPFSTGNFLDQRITTRFNTDEFIEALYATIHETGHSRYEAGRPQEWYGQPVGSARNMSIHESQSLFFEKHIGCSKGFSEFLAGRSSEAFELASPLDPEHFLQAVTWVEPGLIRVNADELTYPIHIIVRFEIESALINGEMEIDDIPGAWHEKMQNYLGLGTENNYRDGCLQDIHWPMGAFGYFPSYTLGAVNAAQLRLAMEKQVGNLDDIIRSGNIEPISQWLSERIWQVGSQLESQDIIQQATGKKTDAQSLIDHFVVRYQLD